MKWIRSVANDDEEYKHINLEHVIELRLVERLEGEIEDDNNWQVQVVQLRMHEEIADVCYIGNKVQCEEFLERILGDCLE